METRAAPFGENKSVRPDMSKETCVDENRPTIDMYKRNLQKRLEKETLKRAERDLERGLFCESLACLFCKSVLSVSLVGLFYWSLLLVSFISLFDSFIGLFYRSLLWVSFIGLFHSSLV